MTQSHALAHVGLRIGRWALPWVAVVCASATISYAINGATAGASSTDPSVYVARCAPITYGYGGYVDSSIVAKSRMIDCGWGL
jgi:hypothetical protein